jgi:subtilase family serine protease
MRTASALAASLTLGAAASPHLLAQSTIEVPHIVERSIDHGSTPPLAESNVIVHLKLHDEAAFHQAVRDLYSPGSPTYHHWMTSADLVKYAPTDAELESVKRELQSHGLTILSVDDSHFSLRAHGTAVNLERAFQTQLHQVEYQGKVIRANITAARLTGAAGDLVDSVTGLTGYFLKPQFVRPKNLVTGEPIPGHPVRKKQALIDLANYFTNECFGGVISEYLTTAGTPLPVALYTGNSYTPNTTKECGWVPKQIQNHYGLPAAYAKGLHGEGQTIVILDFPTNSDFTTDAVGFAEDTGLPPLRSSNYEVVFPDGIPSELAKQYWDATGETQLDIEWSHAIAPAAKIDIMITPTGDWDEFEYAIQYAVSHHLGNVISISYGLPELLFGAYTIKGFEQSLELAAAAGIAVNIASGDGGDEGTGSPNAGGALYPGGSAFATSVGGNSIDLPAGKGNIDIGWGNNATLLSSGQDAVSDPPIAIGMVGGSGGGQSGFISKPVWQSILPGPGRHEPDLSAIADPYTGVVIFAAGQAFAVGGTSLATPVFSGIWTLADQLAGRSLGQAAPLLPSLKGEIQDLVPISYSNNVSGALIDSTGTYTYTAAELIPPLYSTTSFLSVLWDDSGNGSGAFVDLSFGTDSSLTVTKGWDNVTGYGFPIGLPFIEAAAALK